VSADGSRLVTSEGVYKLTPGIGVNPPPLRSTSSEFAGLSPDGAVYAYQGKMVETDTGNPLPNSGLPTAAMEVSWSPDGRWVAFINGAVNPRGDSSPVPLPCILPNIPPGCTSGGTSSVGGTTTSNNGMLAIMSYDASSKTVSNLREIKNVSDKAQWPLFLPDTKGLIYTDEATNDLMILDVATATSTLLAKTMGFETVDDAKANKSFLPYIDQGEARQAFFPTVAPVAVGGYYWVYFDTARRYGNMDTSKISSGLVDPSGIVNAILPTINLPGGGSFTASKQLWVSAIEISPDGTYTHDPSSPAFYLPGQEMGANNHRAFAALDPCLDLGQTCNSGIDCCSGFCSENKCVPAPDHCAETEEACKANSDCCNDGDQCISGFCSFILL
jgi:hypothetical protein